MSKLFIAICSTVFLAHFLVIMLLKPHLAKYGNMKDIRVDYVICEMEMAAKQVPSSVVHISRVC